MHLRKLIISQFRNIDQADLDFAKGLNLFVGHNGQGKTNVLEAIALASSLRPLQALHNADLIKNGCPHARIAGHFVAGSETTLDLTILPQGKKASLNGKALKSALTHAARYPIVSFIPHELNMISGPASLRRHAIDALATSLYFEHAEAKKRYDTALAHRNRLLKERGDRESLHTFTELLLHEGARIIFFRLKALEAIKPYFVMEMDRILGTTTDADIAYVAQEITQESLTFTDCRSSLCQSYSQVAEQERIRKTTLFGPHLDDIVFFLHGLSARHSSSRGQTRALVLALKLAHMRSVKNIRDMSPLVILDDIVSELDEEKRYNLIALIKELETQAFFSATDATAFSTLTGNITQFNVSRGTIYQS